MHSSTSSQLTLEGVVPVILTPHSYPGLGSSRRTFGRSRLLPQIVFALKNMEFFDLVEKQILWGRGLLTDVICREPTMCLDKETIHYTEILASRINDLLERIGLPRNPL